MTGTEAPIDERVTDAGSNTVDVKVEETTGGIGVVVGRGRTGVVVDEMVGVGAGTVGLEVVVFGGPGFTEVTGLVGDFRGEGVGVSGLTAAGGSEG